MFDQEGLFDLSERALYVVKFNQGLFVYSGRALCFDRKGSLLGQKGLFVITRALCLLLRNKGLFDQTRALCVLNSILFLLIAIP